MDNWKQQKKRNIALFTSGDRKDGRFLGDIVEKYNLDIPLYIPHSINELKEIYSNFECVVSFRMHSLIMAYVSGLPIYGISWDQKIDYLFSIIDEPKRVINITDFMKNTDFDIETYEINSIKKKKINEKISADFIDLTKRIKQFSTSVE